MRSKADILYGYGINEIAAKCHVSTKTAGRWKAGQSDPPATALMILAGDLVCMDPNWRGWTFRHGDLVSPEGWILSIGEARSAPFVKQQVAVLMADNRKLRGIAASFPEDQPSPAELPAIKPLAI